MRHSPLDGQANSAAALASAACCCATGPKGGSETTKHPVAEEDGLAMPRRSSAPCAWLLGIATDTPVGAEKASEKVERLAMTNAATAATADGVRRFNLQFRCEDVAIPAQAASMASVGRKFTCRSGTRGPIGVIETLDTRHCVELSGHSTQACVRAREHQPRIRRHYFYTKSSGVWSAVGGSRRKQERQYPISLLQSCALSLCPSPSSGALWCASLQRSPRRWPVALSTGECQACGGRLLSALV